MPQFPLSALSALQRVAMRLTVRHGVFLRHSLFGLHVEAGPHRASPYVAAASVPDVAAVSAPDVAAVSVPDVAAVYPSASTTRHMREFQIAPVLLPHYPLHSSAFSEQTASYAVCSAERIPDSSHLLHR